MTTANARISLILASCLMLGLGTTDQRASAETPAGFSQAELDQMLAPVALYPDTVLSHVLIAATYPLEVVQAARWTRSNPGLKGEYAVAAVEHYPWDPSVKALVAFPELLARMDIDLDWTQRLGDAFLIQEYQVLDTVQYLRDEAYASGHLRSNEYVRVVRETEYIYIEPSVTRVVYVPWYDPYTVYGNWRWSAYPPVYWHRPSGYRSGFSFHWGSGHRLQYGFFFSAVHWPSHRLMVHDHYGYYQRHDKHYGKRYGKHGYGGPRFSSGRELARYEGARHWKHDQDHRRGVAYRRGIDERHAIRASDRSGRIDRSHGHDSRRNAAGHENGRQGRGDDRRSNRHELLRQRARTDGVQARRTAAVTVESNARNRNAPDRTKPDRNSIRRETHRILDGTGNKAYTSGRRGHGAIGKSAGQRSSTAERRRAAPDSASSRQARAQRRASAATPATRSSSGDARPQRARARQPQSSIRPSTSRSTSQSAPRSSLRSRSADTRRAIPSRSRQPAGSVRSDARSSGKTTSRKSSPRVQSRAKRTGTASRPDRAAAPRQTRSSGKSSRAEVLESRRRNRKR